jgi:membrane associated rhomboid family serine protease
MAQLIGQSCVRCSEVIRTILDGDFCPRCGQAVHNQCKQPNDQSDTPKHCSACGGDPSLSLAPDFGLRKLPEQTSNRDHKPLDASLPISSAPDAPAQPAKTAPSPDDMTEFQRTLTSLTPHVYVTPVLFGLNVLVFILMWASGVNLGEPTIPDLLRWGADFGPMTVRGEWWRILTCTFVHIGIVHLLLNMWVLVVAGPLVERMFGNIGFLVVYLVAGLTGSVTSLLWNPLLVSAGASGAIFGIYGGLLGVLLRQHRSIPGKTLDQLRNSGLGFLFYNLFYGLTKANVDSAAHIGGLASGFLCGVVLSQPFTRDALLGRPVRNLLVGGMGILLVISGMIGVYARQAHITDPEGPKVEHGNWEVYYTSGATKAEADRLAGYLVKTEGTNPISAQLKKTAEGYQFRMVIKKEFQNDKKTLMKLEILGAMISRDVFDGAAIEVHACDEHFQTLKALPPRADIRYGVVVGKVEVRFAADINKADAQRLAKYIASLQEGDPTPLSFKLARRGPIMEVHMVVRQDALHDPTASADLRQLRNDIAANVFKGATVEMHLCDELFNVVRVLEQ